MAASQTPRRTGKVGTTGGGSGAIARFPDRPARAGAAQRVVHRGVVDDDAAAGDGVGHLCEALAVAFHDEGAAVVAALVANRRVFGHCGISLGTRGFITANQSGGTSASGSMPA